MARACWPSADCPTARVGAAQRFFTIRERRRGIDVTYGRGLASLARRPRKALDGLALERGKAGADVVAIPIPATGGDGVARVCDEPLEHGEIVVRE